MVAELTCYYLWNKRRHNQNVLLQKMYLLNTVQLYCTNNYFKDEIMFFVSSKIVLLMFVGGVDAYSLLFHHSGLSSSTTVCVLVLRFHQPPTRRHTYAYTHSVMHMHIQALEGS